MFLDVEAEAHRTKDWRNADAAKQARLLEPKLARLALDVASENRGAEIRRDGKGDRWRRMEHGRPPGPGRTCDRGDQAREAGVASQGHRSRQAWHDHRAGPGAGGRVARTGAAYTHLWSRSFGTTADLVIGIAAYDAKDVLLGGYFSGTLQLSTKSLSAVGSRDVFLARLHLP
jgi:hypothetical protein